MESTVNFNTKLKEAASFGQPITEYDPGSRGYKDFVNLARELMGHRPVDLEPAGNEKLSRPAELVQRARQLAQLTNFQFGRGTVQTPTGGAGPAVVTAAAGSSVAATAFSSEPIRTGASAAGIAATVATIASTGVLSSGAAPATAASPGLSAARPGAFMPTAPAPTRRAPRRRRSTTSTASSSSAPKSSSPRASNPARQVLIAGDFNNWSPASTPMSCMGRPGEWTMKLPLRPGRYRYRFVVDGRWVTDPHNHYVETNQFGELNNVVEVE